MNGNIYQFPSKECFQYWFKYLSIGRWDVIKTDDESIIGTLEENEEMCVVTPHTPKDEPIFSDCQGVLTDFKRFKTRPEYYVYNFQNVYFTIQETSSDIYKKLMMGCIFLRNTNIDPENLRSKLDNMFQWIDNTDFFSAPASTRFHGCTPGGLIEHTLKVVYMISKLQSSSIWSDKVKLEDAVLVALVHDWCKINMYESYTKNIKNKDTGVWESETAFKVKSEPMSCLGHGVSSMFLAERFFKLSVEEAAAIRWHMGEYNVADNEMNDLHQANETYPMVQLLQFADRLSIVKYL